MASGDYISSFMYNDLLLRQLFLKNGHEKELFEQRTQWFDLDERIAVVAGREILTDLSPGNLEELTAERFKRLYV